VMSKVILLFVITCINLPLIQSQDRYESDLANKRSFPDASLCFDSGIAYLSNKKGKLGNRNNVESASACRDKCAETNKCEYWTWIKKRRNSKCKLFSDVRRGEFRKQKSKAVSGTLSDGCTRDTPECGLFQQSIVGGKAASLGEFPWAVFLGRRDKKSGDIEVRCGGSLISNNAILTAAHCFDNKEKWWPKFVRLGELDWTDKNDGAEHQDIDIAKVIKHPEYNISTNKNDIAILHLRKNVNYDKGTVRPVCLPTDYSGPGKIEGLKNDPVAIGWGRLSTTGAQAQTLQKVAVPLVKNAICNKAWGDHRWGPINSDSQICAGTGETDTCTGDSGGSLLSNELSPRYSIIGITSFGGNECADSEVPGVYTSVQNYLDWIAQQLK